MAAQTARPESARGANRPGLDLCLAAKSRLSLSQNPIHAQAQRRLRRQQLAQQVHRLGARVLFEFLAEIDRYHDLGDDLDQRLERYARLEPDVLRAVGGDRFPPSPLRAIGRAR